MKGLFLLGLSLGAAVGTVTGLLVMNNSKRAREAVANTQKKIQSSMKERRAKMRLARAKKVQSV